MNVALAGKIAYIEAVEQDYEGRLHQEGGRMSSHPEEGVARPAHDVEDRHPAVQTRSMLSSPDVEDVWQYTLLGALAAGAAILVYQNLPDIIRYLKMRSM